MPARSLELLDHLLRVRPCPPARGSEQIRSLKPEIPKWKRGTVRYRAIHTIDCRDNNIQDATDTHTNQHRAVILLRDWFSDCHWLMVCGAEFKAVSFYTIYIPNNFSPRSGLRSGSFHPSNIEKGIYLARLRGKDSTAALAQLLEPFLF